MVAVMTVLLAGVGAAAVVVAWAGAVATARVLLGGGKNREEG